MLEQRRMTPAAVGAPPVASEAGVEAETLVLFLATGLIVIGAHGLMSRSGTMTIAALKLYGVVVLLVGSAGLVWRRWRSLETAAIVLVVVPVAAVWLPGRWLLVPLVVLTLMFARTVDLRWTLRTLLSPVTLAAAALAAAVILDVMQYSDFRVMDKLPYGDVHQDTLFHASVASMIKTYGMPSTGLNGLVPLHYHVLSNRIVAGLSELSGIGVLEVYGATPTVVFAPLLLVAVTWSSCRLVTDQLAGAVTRHWVSLCAVLILLKSLPDSLILYDSYLFGDSYTIAVALLVLGIPALATTRVRLTDLVAAVGLIVLSGLSKGSVGIFGLVLLWVRVALVPRVNRRRDVTIAVAATVIFSWLMAPAANAGVLSNSFTEFLPFFYATSHGTPWGPQLQEAVNSLLSAHLPSIELLSKAVVAAVVYLGVNLIVSWVVIAHRILASGWKGLFRHTDGLFNLAAVTVALGSVLFKILGGWDFINPAMFVAFPFLVMTSSRWSRLRRVPMSTMIGVVAIAAVVLVGRDYRRGVGVAVKVHRATGRLPAAEFTTALLALRARDAERSSVVVIAAEDFPKPPTKFLYCTALPFVYPAVSERAWVGLIRPEGDCPYQYYGYGDYLIGTPRRLVEPSLPAGSVVLATSALTVKAP